MREFSLGDGAVELLLIRHGDATPDGEIDDFETVYRDLPLSGRGRAQARALADRLAGHDITAVYASGLRRADETAQAIADRIGLEVHRDERLREVEIGGLDEPRHPAEFGAHLERLAELAIEHGGWSQLEGSESSASIRERMRAATAAIVASHPGARVAVVSHAGAINAHIADVIGLESDFFFPAANTSINIIRARGDARLLVTVNDIAHLHVDRGVADGAR
jgi:broad specificity phosphatase PhoE